MNTLSHINFEYHIENMGIMILNHRIFRIPLYGSMTRVHVIILLTVMLDIEIRENSEFTTTRSSWDKLFMINSKWKWVNKLRTTNLWLNRQKAKYHWFIHQIDENKKLFWQTTCYGACCPRFPTIEKQNK